MLFFGKKHKERKAQKREAREKSSRPVANGESAADDGAALPSPSLPPADDGAALPSRPPPDEAARKMRGRLQETLQRPVILSDERRRDKAIRTVMKHRRAVIALGVLGTGIAAVATAGTAAVILGIVTVSLPVLDVPTFFDTKVLDPNRGVTLEPDAVPRLFAMHDAEKEAGAVQAAIDKKRGTGPDAPVTLTGEDIAAVTPEPQLVPAAGVDPVRAGVRMGLTVIGSGLLLLALTLIPHDVHGLMTRAASVILIVGALIVAAALANGSWLTGR